MTIQSWQKMSFVNDIEFIDVNFNQGPAPLVSFIRPAENRTQEGTFMHHGRPYLKVVTPYSKDMHYALVTAVSWLVSAGMSLVQLTEVLEKVEAFRDLVKESERDLDKFMKDVMYRAKTISSRNFVERLTVLKNIRKMRNKDAAHGIALISANIGFVAFTNNDQMPEKIINALRVICMEMGIEPFKLGL